MPKQSFNRLAVMVIIQLLSSPAVAELSTPDFQHVVAIGATNNGCFFGAQALPGQGKNFIAVNLQRKRYYGHPILIQTLELLAEKAEQKQIGVLQIGDLSQKYGGPMSYGHRSHQTGLDADIWFDLLPQADSRINKQRNTINQPSMLTANKNKLNSLWSDKHRKLLEIAAKIQPVDRIFVHPLIKRDLCNKVTGDRQWLKKIRPWYHHDAHFHIRLQCPENSPDCIKQAPVPEGDSCDATLDWWFQKHPVSKKTKAKTKTRPPLPLACLTVLANQ